MNKKFGLLSLSDRVRAAGRGRDTVLAHITPEEAAFLKARGGRGTINPKTGLIELEEDGFSGGFTDTFTGFSGGFTDTFTGFSGGFTDTFTGLNDTFNSAFVDFTGANNSAFDTFTGFSGGFTDTFTGFSGGFTDTFVDTYVDPNVNTFVDTYVDPNVNTFVDTYVDTYVDPNVNTFVDTFVEPFVDPNVNTFVDTFVEPYVDTFVEPYVDTFVEPYVDTFVEPYVDPYQVLNDFVDPFAGFDGLKEDDVTGPEIDPKTDITETDDELKPDVEVPTTTTPDDATLKSYPGVLPDGTRKGEPGYNEKVLQLIEDVKNGISPGRNIYGPGVLPDGTRRGDPGYAEKLQALVDGVNAGTISVVANSTFNPDLYKKTKDAVDLTGGTTTGNVLTGGTATGDVLTDGTATGDVLTGGTTTGDVLTDGTTTGNVLTDGTTTFSYTDPTASYRYDILGNLSPDAFYRSQFSPQFANEIYSNVNPNFSIDEQGNPVDANAPTTGDVTTAPLAGDFVDAQGNLITDTVGRLKPGVDLSMYAEPSDGKESNFSALYDNAPTPTPRPTQSELDAYNKPGLAAAISIANDLSSKTLRGEDVQLRPSLDLSAEERKAAIQTIASEIDYRSKLSNPDLIQEALGVSGVIRNRLENGEWGDNLVDVVKSPYQFSGWNANARGDPNRDPTLVPTDSAKYRAAEIAYDQTFGKGVDVTGGALNFYALRSMKSGEPPSWADGKDAVTVGPTTFVYGIDPGGSNRNVASTGQLPPGVSSYNQITPPADIPIKGTGTSTDPIRGLDYTTSPSTIDKAVNAIPGAAVDLGLGAMIPLYGAGILAGKVIGWATGSDFQSPGSRIAEGVFGGPGSFGNAPASAVTKDYTRPAEAPAEISRLSQTAGGTPIISEPATGPIQYPPATIGEGVTTQSAVPPGATSFGQNFNASTLPGATSFGQNIRTNFTGGMSYTPEEGAVARSVTGDQTTGGVVPKEYQAPFTAPDRAYILPEELAFAGKPETPSLLDYQPPGQSYELPDYVARMGEPQPYSPPFQPINKQYALPEELANLGRPATSSPLDYANPSTKYVLPPSAGGVSPPGLTRSPDVSSARSMISSTGSGFTGSSIDGTLSRSGGISSLGGGGGGGTNVSVGGGGGGGGGAARPTTTSGSLGSVAARNFDFQGIAGANRQFKSPVVGSGRTVDFGTPSRQLAYDLNLPAIQQAAMNPNSYRGYLSQYKQLFG